MSKSIPSNDSTFFVLVESSNLAMGRILRISAALGKKPASDRRLEQWQEQIHPPWAHEFL